MGSYWMCYVRPRITSLEIWEHLCFVKCWKKAFILTCGSYNFASVDELSWVIGVPGYYAWTDETFFFFSFLVLYSLPQDDKLELILCWGQQAYWLPGILTYFYHRCFIWHAYTLCATSFFCFLFILFFNAALDCGRENALLCVAATETRFVSAPKENSFHNSWGKHGSDFLEVKVAEQIDR